MNRFLSRRKSPRHTAKLLAIVAVVPLLITACSGDSGPEPDDATEQPASSPVVNQSAVTSAELDSDGDGMLAFDEFRVAMKAASAEYMWPDAYVPDVDAILDGADEQFSIGVFEPGYELTMLTVYNGCAWNQAWLDARRSGDSSAEANALDVMTNVLPFLHLGGQTTDEWAVESASKAALGDPTMANQFVEANCKEVIWT